MNFKDKVVLITGSSLGIGAGIAEYFSTLNATLVLIGRNEKRLNEVATKCKKQNIPEPLCIVADLNIEEDCVRVIHKTIEQFGQLDVLINNAAIIIAGSIETQTLQQWDDTMNTNLRSVFYITQLAVPHLCKTKGNIVNISAPNGIRACKGRLAFNVSKAGLEHFTKCISLELASKGIRVNTINPGVIKSVADRPDDSRFQFLYHEFLAARAPTHPMGRVGTLTETAQAVAFIASDLASFITGTMLPVDGGKLIGE